MDDGDLPKLSRSWNTAFRRFSRWCANGVGLRIFAAMAEDAGSGHPSARSMIVRAHQQAAGGKGGLRPLAAPAAAWPARPRSSWPAGPAGGAPDLLPPDKHLRKERHLDGCCISKPRPFRRIATRCKQTARNYLAVAAIAWIWRVSTGSAAVPCCLP
jgi:hypothetical protein